MPHHSTAVNAAAQGVVRHDVANESAFFDGLWQLFGDSVESQLSVWESEQTLRDKVAVLTHRQNYETVLRRFCRSMPLRELPIAAGVSATTGRPYTDGCPDGDPGFARTGEFMLGSGLNCPLPSRCVPPGWLAQLEATFVAHSVSYTHLTLPTILLV